MFRLNPKRKLTGLNLRPTSGNQLNLEDDPIEVKQFSEGYSNLTFLIKIGEWESVMRRPPFGKIPPKAHDMEREYKLLEKINPVSRLLQNHTYVNTTRTLWISLFISWRKKMGLSLTIRSPRI